MRLFLATVAVVVAPPLAAGLGFAPILGTEDRPPRRQQPASKSSADFSDRLGIAWKRPLGQGNSRVTVADGRAITLFSDGEFDNLVALDADTGEEVWRYRIAPTYIGHDGSMDGPHASALLNEGVLYSLGSSGHLFAVDLDGGGEVWSRDLVAELGAQAPFWGFASTPVVDRNVLVVPTNSTAGSISGFDKLSGELLWSVGDDRVGYQSPAVMTLGGIRQVVAVTNHQIMGIVPDTGEVLWTHRHSEKALDGSSEPVPLGGDRFLLTPSSTEQVSDAALYEVTRDGAGWQVEELWRSGALKYNYTAPVLYEDRLYGFQRGFLTCVDPGTGKAIWKSRPPGGNNLTLVADVLVIFATEGFVVVVAADAEGYEELARVRVFERGAYSAPVFADGMVFVRNHEHIAAVRLREPGKRPAVTERDPAAATEEEATVTRGERDPALNASAFMEFVRRVELAEDKLRLVKEFMDSQHRFPVVEGDRLVHFIYRGAATDVGIQGSMTEWGRPDPMQRIPGTDLFYRSYTLEPNTRWQYFFEVEFENWIGDPLNPRTVPGEWAEVSELVMPGWVEPTHLQEPTGDGGRIESFELESDILDNRRDVKVYLPPGYPSGEDAYPLIVVVDGLAVLEHGLMDRSLDNLISRSVAPLVVAFVGPPKVPYESFSEAGGP
ncbi:MAG: PQQ-binding-like beta-propeller repeat protein, partial [Longimicrobiales bacterium]